MVLLEEFRGFGGCLFGGGLVLHNTCGIEGQMDLGWRSHAVVVFV